MGRIVRIPVQRVRSTESQTRTEPLGPSQQQAHPHEIEERPSLNARPAKDEPAAVAPEPVQDTVVSRDGEGDGETDWCDRALRLQAEMENYRRRQRQWAQEQIEAEHQRLLRAFVRVIDDLERALEAPEGHDGALRQGIQLTHRAALQLLAKEGVERIQADGQAFDPAWHEAVSTVDHNQVHAAPDTVIQVVEPGYRLRDQLLRPAKVVVAVGNQ